MTRRYAFALTGGALATLALIEVARFYLWAFLNVPPHTVILDTGLVCVALVALFCGGGYLMRTREEDYGTGDAEEHMEPLRRGGGRTANRLTADLARHRWLFAKLAAARGGRGAPSPAPAPSPVPSLTGSKEKAAPTNVPGRECVASHSPAGDPPRHRHRKPPARRQRAAGPVPQPAVAYMTAPPPDSPARETPAPGSEGLRLEGQEPATGDEWTDPRCDTACPSWVAGDCETLCDPRYVPTPAEDAYMAEHHQVAMLTVGPAENDPERPGTPANTREQHERLAHTGELLLAAVPDVAHEEAPEEDVADAEDAPIPALPPLPGDQDDPGPLYSDDTAWHDFTALKDLAPEAEVAS